MFHGEEGKKTYKEATKGFTDNVDKWESGELGMDEDSAAIAEIDEDEIDSALGLQLISIRLKKEMIDGFKKEAGKKGIGYQTLMKIVLFKYLAVAEKHK